MTHVKLDYSKIQVVEIDGIDHRDYPSIQMPLLVKP